VSAGAIAVCVKPVPDPRGRTGATEAERRSLRVSREGVDLVPDRGDRVALEAALRVRSEFAAAGWDGASVTVFLMGPPAAETAARQCLALGADRAVLVSDRALAGSDALVTAKVLARAIGKLGGFGLVLTGVESSDGGTGQVGPSLAALLGLDFLPGVTALRAAGDGLVVEVREGDRVAEYGAALPVAASVSRGAYPPRTATLAGIVQARGRPLEILACADLGLTAEEVGALGSPTAVVRLLPYGDGPRAQMLEGTVEEQARALAALLRGHGFAGGERGAAR